MRKILTNWTNHLTVEGITRGELGEGQNNLPGVRREIKNRMRTQIQKGICKVEELQPIPMLQVDVEQVLEEKQNRDDARATTYLATGI